MVAKHLGRCEMHVDCNDTYAIVRIGTRSSSIANEPEHAAFYFGRRRFWICLATKSQLKFILKGWQLMRIILAGWINRQ